MTDELNVVNDTQVEVVDPQVDDVPAVGEDESVATSQHNKQPQSIEENQAFAKLRRELEAKNQELSALNEKLAESQRSQNYVEDILHNDFGYRGNLFEMADELMAMQTGQDVDTIRSVRLASEQEEQKRIEENLRIQNIEHERDYYKNLAVEKIKSDLLKDVKKVFPDCKAESVDEFGVEFAQLINNGVSAELAYSAIMNLQNATKKPVPPEIGTVNNTSAPEREYFTREDVAKMSKEEVHKNWDKIQKSRINLKW